VNRTTLRRRIEALERGRGDVVLTAQEAAALAGDGPAWPHSSTAMAKFARRFGLEALVLASFEA
jgi:hypothetical protein